MPWMRVTRPFSTVQILWIWTANTVSHFCIDGNTKHKTDIKPKNGELLLWLLLLFFIRWGFFDCDWNIKISNWINCFWIESLKTYATYIYGCFYYCCWSLLRPHVSFYSVAFSTHLQLNNINAYYSKLVRSIYSDQTFCSSFCSFYSLFLCPD